MRSIGLSVFSAILLVLAFPNFNFSFLIWVALVPLFFMIDGKKPSSAFGWAWLTGFLFFLATHYWIIHATLPGMFLFNAYLAVYFGLFGLGYSLLQKIHIRHKLWALPALWITCELIRDRFLSGFGWACLGHSQYQVLPMIQIADITGVFGISFVIVMVNILLKEIISHGPNLGERFKLEAVAVIVILVAIVGYGTIKNVLSSRHDASSFAVIVVQPNIPQSRDMVMMSPSRVEENLVRLTNQALQKDPQPLVIWPESAVPNGLWQSPERYERMKQLVKHQHVQLLFGAVTRREEQYYNSAILLSAKGEEGIADKRHLVPFGEFLPLRPWSNFIENYVPIGDFTPGKKPVLFPMSAKGEGEFGVLICFEDTVAPMVRSLTNAGATWLVNITNDGWFKDSNEPHLHLASSVLQAVANRRTIIRAANTGVSSQINSDGSFRMLTDTDGKTVMIEGAMTAMVHPQKNITLYTRYGDIFAYFSIVFTIGGLINRRKLL